MNDTDARLNHLIGGLQALATIDDQETLSYLSSVGLRMFIVDSAGFRTPHIILVDDRKIHASGPKLIDELFDELVLENKLQAANELRSRLMNLFVELNGIDQLCSAKIGRREIDCDKDMLLEIVGGNMVDAITKAKQEAYEICLFAMKLRKALLTPPADPLESELVGQNFRIYQILKHRKTIWSDYADLADEFDVDTETIGRYLRKLDDILVKHRKTILRPRGENKCRLESISDESIRE